MILNARQNAQLALDGNAVGMGELDDLAGQLDVLLIGQAASVDHDGRIAAVDARLDAFEALAMIQMQRNRHRTVLAVFAHGVADALCADALGFHRAVHEVEFAAHKGVGCFRTLQNGAGMQQFMDANRRLNLPDAVHVERALTIAVLIRRFQNRSHRYKHTVTSCFFRGMSRAISPQAGLNGRPAFPLLL